MHKVIFAQRDTFIQQVTFAQKHFLQIVTFVQMGHFSTRVKKYTK